MDERVERVGVCSECGSDALWAWYPQPERQSISVIIIDGEARYDYTGCISSGEEPGEDDQYLCGGCSRLTDTIEEMVGLPPAVVGGQSAIADCVTCDFLVPLTVTVDLETGLPTGVVVHLDGFQSTPEGPWVKVPKGSGLDNDLHHLYLRAAYLEGRLVGDGESELADKALAIADKVMAEREEIPVAFTVATA